MNIILMIKLLLVQSPRKFSDNNIPFFFKRRIELVLDKAVKVYFEVAETLSS